MPTCSVIMNPDPTTRNAMVKKEKPSSSPTGSNLPKIEKMKPKKINLRIQPCGKCDTPCDDATMMKAIMDACRNGQLTEEALRLFVKSMGWPSPEEVTAEKDDDYELHFKAQKRTDHTNNATLCYAYNSKMHKLLNNFDSDLPLLRELGWQGITGLRCPLAPIILGHKKG